MHDSSSTPASSAQSNSGFRTEEQLAAGFWIWMILSPAFIIFGSVGNVISILVLCRKQMIKRVSSVYLIALAVADLLIIYAGLFQSWLGQLLQQDVAGFSSIGCKLQRFQIHFLRDVSAWVLVAITMERVMATKFLLKYKLVFTRKSACLSVLVITLSALIINGHFLVGFGLAPIAGLNGTLEMKICVPILNYGDFIKVWPTIQLLKSCVVPVFFMGSGSVLILAELIRVKKNAVSPSSQSVATTSSRLNFPAMSGVLLSLNLLFLCTTTPVFLYQSVDPFFYLLELPTFVKMKDPTLAALIALNNLNHVMNFIMYCFMGSRFRLELKAMCQSAKNRVIPLPVA